jgi:hypothetical protein
MPGSHRSANWQHNDPSVAALPRCSIYLCLAVLESHGLPRLALWFYILSRARRPCSRYSWAGCALLGVQELAHSQILATLPHGLPAGRPSAVPSLVCAGSSCRPSASSRTPRPWTLWRSGARHWTSTCRRPWGTRCWRVSAQRGQGADAVFLRRERYSHWGHDHVCSNKHMSALLDGGCTMPRVHPAVLATTPKANLEGRGRPCLTQGACGSAWARGQSETLRGK